MMTLEERIERLERTNRRYRRMFALLGVVAVCTVGISATQDHDVPDVIQAKEFRLVDDAGTTWGSMYTSEKEGAAISLYRPVELDPELPSRFPSVSIRSNVLGAGSINLGSGAPGDHSGVTLMAGDGHGLVLVRGGDRDAVVAMEANKEGVGGSIDVGGLNSKITLTSTDGQCDILIQREGGSVFLIASEETNAIVINEGDTPLAMMGTLKKGDPAVGHLFINSSEKKILCHIGPNALGNGAKISFNGDNQETSCLALGVGDDGNGSILVSDQQGNWLVAMGGKPTENGAESYLALFGAEDKPVALLGAARDGGSIVLKNKTGEAVCTLTVDEYGNGSIGVWDRNGEGRTLKPEP